MPTTETLCRDWVLDAAAATVGAALLWVLSSSLNAREEQVPAHAGSEPEQKQVGAAASAVVAREIGRRLPPKPGSARTLRPLDTVGLRVLTSGEAESLYAQRSFWQIVGVGLETSSDEKARIRERALARYSELLERRSHWGPAPWEESRFQLVSAPRAKYRIVGANMTIEASPEQTVSWHERERGEQLAGTARSALVARIELLELKRRRAEYELVGLVLERVDAGGVLPTPMDAIHVTSRNVRFLSASDSYAIREWINRGAGIPEALTSRVAEIVK